MAGQDQVADDVLDLLKQLKSNRANFNSHCRDVAELVIPVMKHEFTGRTINQTKGEERNDDRFDSTASIALGRFAAIMDSLLTPRNATWHKLKASNEELNKERDVRIWFEELNKALFKHRYAPSANFASQNQMVFEHVGAFGNAPMFIDQSVNDIGLRYKALSLGGVFFAENHQGLVDTVVRSFFLTAKQAVQKWPKGLPTRIIDKANQRGESEASEFEFVHCVKPRADVDASRDDFRGMKFVSYYVSVEGKVTLEEGGFRSMPYAISRHKQGPREVYARSPAMEVLPSIRTINEQKVTLLKQGHRTVDPILLAFDDGNVAPFSMRPGAVNYGGVSKEGRSLIQPLPVGSVNTGKEMMDDERRDINDVFLVTLFQILVDSPTMTATEVLERVKEKGILLAPTFGRQESEYLGPMIDREIDLLDAQGLIPELPGVLVEASGEYEIDYDSPFSRAQKAEEATGLMRTFQWATDQAAATGNPELLDHFNPDEIIPALARINNIPEKWLRGKEEVAAIRQGRVQAQQAEEAAKLAPGGAAVLNAATKAAQNAPEVLDAATS